MSGHHREARPLMLGNGPSTLAQGRGSTDRGRIHVVEHEEHPVDEVANVVGASEPQALRPGLESVDSFHDLFGKSAAMRHVYRLLEQASKLDIAVLLNGETGTGKELAARAIHHHSARKGRRFVPVNCGALPAGLVESELFGHVKGAFSGAVGSRAGLFEEAEGGTLFLDEVGDLQLADQVKLNRALQGREIRRVGDNRPTQIDVRVIAATHRDLKAEVAAGRFREDLFYRLNVFPVVLPALRERREDVPLLATHFLEKHARASRKQVSAFDPDALRALCCGYPWPGNVRELENAVERSVAVAKGTRISLRDLPPDVTEKQEGAIPRGLLTKLSYREAVDLARDRVSRDYLTLLMREYEGNVTHAASRAGMERETLHRLLNRYGIRSDEFKRR